MTAEHVALTLVNVNQTQPRTVVLQMGAYAEHQCVHVALADRQAEVGASSFTVRLAPGSGARLLIHMHRYANSPTLQFPWDS